MDRAQPDSSSPVALVVEDDAVDGVVNAIVTGASTGKIGDGKVAADGDTTADLDAEGFDELDLGEADLGFHFVVGDAVGVEAAGQRGQGYGEVKGFHVHETIPA